jgi:tetratricopeptide (TPR) repeat protein
MPITADEGPMERRRLILRDSLHLAVLLLVTAGLFGVTFFLFRSFSTHRTDLARRWSARGRMALQTGKPDEAITALRTALVYSPGSRDDELLLAQALEQTHRPEQAEESYQYLTGLWTADPGYGPINLQLARLERKRDQPQDAINSYRAAIYGTWQGGGLEERAAVRLELAQYLIAQHDLEAARLELLIVGGDAPESYGRDMQIGNLLEQTSAPGDAETYYRRALQAAKRNRQERDAARDAIARMEAVQAAAVAAADQEKDSTSEATSPAQGKGPR